MSKAPRSGRWRGDVSKIAEATVVLFIILEMPDRKASSLTPGGLWGLGQQPCAHSSGTQSPPTFSQEDVQLVRGLCFRTRPASAWLKMEQMPS